MLVVHLIHVTKEMIKSLQYIYIYIYIFTCTEEATEMAA